MYLQHLLVSQAVHEALLAVPAHLAVELVLEAAALGPACHLERKH
jgi:hypothetical protein